MVDTVCVYVYNIYTMLCVCYCYIYIHACMYVCMYVYIYIYICIHACMYVYYIYRIRYISIDPADTASAQVSELLLSKGVCTKALQLGNWVSGLGFEVSGFRFRPRV